MYLVLFLANCIVAALLYLGIIEAEAGSVCNALFRFNFAQVNHCNTEIALKFSNLRVLATVKSLS